MFRYNKRAASRLRANNRPIYKFYMSFLDEWYDPTRNLELQEHMTLNLSDIGVSSATINIYT